MRAALDTNILGYAEGTNGPACKDTALSLIDRLPARSHIITTGKESYRFRRTTAQRKSAKS